MRRHQDFALTPVRSRAYNMVSDMALDPTWHCENAAPTALHLSPRRQHAAPPNGTESSFFASVKPPSTPANFTVTNPPHWSHFFLQERPVRDARHVVGWHSTRYIGWMRRQAALLVRKNHVIKDAANGNTWKAKACDG